MIDADNVNADENSDNKQQTQDKTDNADDKGENMIPKHRFDSVNEKRKAAESTLAEIATELMGDVPDDMKDVIPDLPPG